MYPGLYHLTRVNGRGRSLPHPRTDPGRLLRVQQLRQCPCDASISWPLGRGQCPVENFPVGRDGVGVVGEQVAQARRHGAASTSPAVDPSGLAATGAAAPDLVVGPGAQRAQRLVDCSAAQRSDRAAARAADPRLLARRAPRLAGHLRDNTGSGASADRAGQDGARYALAAERSVGCSNLYRSTPPAFDAGFVVGGIGDQAVRAQRSALLVAGGGLADRPAPAAGLGAGLRGAVAAQPLSVDSPVQVDDSTAAGAGRADDHARFGVAQGIDQPQHDRVGASAPAPVSNSGRSCNAQASRRRCPDRGATFLTAAAATSVDRAASAAVITSRRALERVTPIVGRTRHAAWVSVAVARVDRADSAALAAGFADRTADSAVPVVAGTCAGSPLWVRPRHGRVH